MLRSLIFIRGEDVSFIQVVKPSENVDQAPIGNEESVEMHDKSGGIDVHDPVGATESNQLLDDVDSLFKEVMNVIPDLVGRVDELRTKLVQTLTSNFTPQETEVGNTSSTAPSDDSRKPNDSKEPDLPPDVSCLQPDNVDEQHFRYYSESKFS
ncbi:hypothetical protein Tco_0512525 [Tanacetum coccineum]